MAVESEDVAGKASQPGRRKPLFRPEVIKNRYDPAVEKRTLDGRDDPDND